MSEMPKDLEEELRHDLRFYGNAVVHYALFGDGSVAARRLDPFDVFPELAKYLAADRLPKEPKP